MGAKGSASGVVPKVEATVAGRRPTLQAAHARMLALWLWTTTSKARGSKSGAKS